MRRALTMTLLGLAACTGASSSTTVQSTSATTGITSEPPTTTAGGGSTGAGDGEATLTNADGFGFTPARVEVRDANGRSTYQRVLVTVSEESAVCGGTHLLQTVRLTFGQDGVPLAAGTFDVDGGARIAWRAGDADSELEVDAVSGIINCNSVYSGLVAGSFIGQLPLADGGTSELSGIFTAAPCDDP